MNLPSDSAQPPAASERLLRQQAVLAELTSGLIRSEAPGLTVAEVLAAAGQGLAVQRVSRWHLSADAERLRSGEVWSRGPTIELDQIELTLALAPVYFAALASSEALAIADVASDRRAAELLGEYFQPLGIGASLDVPIQIGGRLEGVLCYEHIGQGRDWSPGDQLFGIAIAHLLSLLAERAGRAEVEQRSSSELEARVTLRTAELEQANEALRESERRLRQIIDLVPHYIFAKDENGRFLIVNRAVAELNGTTVEAMLSGSLETLARSPEEGRRYLEEDREVIRSRRPKLIPEEIMTDAEGRPHIVRTIKIPFTFPGTSGGAVLGVATDITERKRAEAERDHLEQQLRRAQKMEAIGTLAGGIAHDFNNILTSILGFADLLSKRLVQEPEPLHDVEQITQAAKRASDLVRQILTFSRQQRQSRSVIPLQSTLEEALRLLRAAIPANIEFAVYIDPDAPPVLADATQIHQVMMNLGANAAAAMESGMAARLEVDYRPFEVDAAFAGAHPELRPGPHVCLSVRDNGHGMDLATVDRVFEPFFTTKDPTRGTGLGLAVVHGIVRDHGGVIVVESRPESGTRFRLFFPTHAESAASVPLERAGLRRGRGERVLCIDDEPANAQLLDRILVTLGYAVESYTSATGALAVFRLRPDAFDLVITDLTMPVMSGVELAIEAMATRPDIPVLLITGFSDSISEEDAREAGLRGLLFKPFSLESLGESVARCLDRVRLEHR
ncbi:MAG: ATP-binding protein [Acidobacteriota bacterium]